MPRNTHSKSWKLFRPATVAVAVALPVISLFADPSALARSSESNEHAEAKNSIAWVTPLASPASIQCTGIAATRGGPVAIGQFVGSLSAGNGVSAKGFAGRDGYVAGFDLDGKARWITAIGGSRDDRLRAIAADADGNVYVTGYVIGSSDDSGDQRDSQALPADAAGADAVLAKLSATGKQLWTRRIAGANADIGTAIAVAADGTVFWGGQFEKSAAMVGFVDIGALVGEGASDLFVAAVDADGKPRWLKSFGGKQSDTLSALASDGHGGVFIAGAYEGILPIRHAKSIDLMRAAGARDIFLMHLLDKGEIDWAHSLSGKQQEYPVALHGDGRQVYLSGNFQDHLRLDAKTTLSSQGVFDGFVSAWSLDGQLVWAKSFGGPTAEIVQGMSMDGDSRMTLVGSFLGPFDFGPGTSKLETSQLRSFVANIDGKGRWINEYAIQSREPTEVFGVANGRGDNVYACGVAKGEIELGGRSGDEDADDDEDHEKDEKAEHARMSEHGEHDRVKDNAREHEEEDERSKAFVVRLRTR